MKTLKCPFEINWPLDGKFFNNSMSMFWKLCFFQDAVPHQPETATDETDDFEFTKLECLLFAFHTVASQAPTFLTENPDLLKDFKVSLMQNKHYDATHLIIFKKNYICHPPCLLEI